MAARSRSNSVFPVAVLALRITTASKSGQVIIGRRQDLALGLDFLYDVLSTRQSFARTPYWSTSCSPGPRRQR